MTSHLHSVGWQAGGALGFQLFFLALLHDIQHGPLRGAGLKDTCWGASLAQWTLQTHSIRRSHPLVNCPTPQTIDFPKVVSLRLGGAQHRALSVLSENPYFHYDRWGLLGPQPLDCPRSSCFSLSFTYWFLIWVLKHAGSTCRDSVK